MEGPTSGNNIFPASEQTPSPYNSTCGVETVTLNVETKLDVVAGSGGTATGNGTFGLTDVMMDFLWADTCNKS
jgi:O-glycosyl hydrolase